MQKFDALVNAMRKIIDARFSKIVQCDVHHAERSESIQLTTKELKAALLQYGEFVKIMASGRIWTCTLSKKSLGCGVYSVWLSCQVYKPSYSEQGK